MRYYPTLIAAILCAGLAACSSTTVKETLGIDRQAPDEFRVVSRPPLSVPPQFDLRPPSVTAESPTTLPADQQAKSAVLGTPMGTAPEKLPAGTQGESLLLKNAGADQADPSVRNSLIEEKIIKEEEQEDDGWWGAISNFDKKDPEVDAGGEAERIKKNKEEGKPVTEGETPETGGKDTGVLGRILGY